MRDRITVDEKEWNRGGSHATAVAATAPKTNAAENTEVEKWWLNNQCIAQYPEDDSINTVLTLLSLAIARLTFTIAPRLEICSPP
jgi:hypothetical protein